MILAIALIIAVVILSVDYAYYCSTVPDDVIPCANHVVYHEYLTSIQVAMQNYILSNIF